MTQKTFFLVLVAASLLAAPALAQPAAAPAVAPVEVAPAVAPVEVAPAVAPAEAAPAEAAPVEAAPAPVETVPAEAAPAAEPIAPPPPAEGEGENEDKVECVLGEVCFGPVLTGGLLNVIGLGVHARYGEYVGFGFDYQWFSLGAKGVTAGLSLVTLNGRLYPFAGAFFLSTGFSYQSFSADAIVTTTVMKNGVSVPAKVNIGGSIGIPQIQFGLGFMGHDGFILGIDLALGIPLGGADVEFDVSGGPNTGNKDIDDQKADIDGAADALVKLLPVTFQLNLLRIGYLF